ncbi:MAG: hypothetical protein GY841_03660 [FCB group bacterium]|nr:hypothetical protein [FCB group bacterium]
MKRYTSFLLLIVFFGAGCDKDDPLPPAPPTADETPPTVEITTPMDGYSYTQGDIINIKASADDNVAVVRVIFYRDGIFMFSDPSEPYETEWSTNKITSTGSHIITARAYDQADNEAESAEVSINIYE